MLPFNPWIQMTCQILIVVLPIITSYQGVPLPPWVGLAVAVLNAITTEILKRMAPAADVHKDSELPLPPLPPTADEIAAAYDRLHRQRAEERLRQASEVKG